MIMTSAQRDDKSPSLAGARALSEHGAAGAALGGRADNA